MTVPEIIAAIASNTKTAIDIVKGIKSLKGESHLPNKLATDLYERLLSIQSLQAELLTTQDTLTQENAALRKKISEFDNWEVEKTQYIRHQLTKNGFIVVPNDSSKSIDQLPHYCPECFDRKVKHLFKVDDSAFRTAYLCQTCKYGFDIPKATPKMATRPYRPF